MLLEGFAVPRPPAEKVHEKIHSLINNDSTVCFWQKNIEKMFLDKSVWQQKRNSHLSPFDFSFWVPSCHRQTERDPARCTSCWGPCTRPRSSGTTYSELVRSTSSLGQKFQWGSHGLGRFPLLKKARPYTTIACECFREAPSISAHSRRGSGASPLVVGPQVA